MAIVGKPGYPKMRSGTGSSDLTASAAFKASTGEPGGSAARPGRRHLAHDLTQHRATTPPTPRPASALATPAADPRPIRVCTAGADVGHPAARHCAGPPRGH
jgi:hypothetical protein